MKKLTVWVADEIDQKISDEADKSKTPARPIVSKSDIVRELLARPLHPHARVRGGA